MKKIISTALLVVMLVTAVFAAIPFTAGAAYTEATSSSSLKVPEGVTEAQLTTAQLETYINTVLNYSYSSVEQMFDYEYSKGYLYYVDSPANAYTLYVNKYTGAVYYVNNVTGQIVSSNPYNVSGLSALNKSLLMSQIVVDYTENIDTTQGKSDFNSMDQAAKRSQIKVSAIKGGLRVSYTLGDTTTRFLLPGQLTAEAYEENILIPILEYFAELLEANCSEKYPDTEFSFLENEDYLAYNYGCINLTKSGKAYGSLRDYLKDMLSIIGKVFSTQQLKNTAEYKELKSLHTDLTKLTGFYTVKNPASFDTSKPADLKKLETMHADYPATQDGTAIYVYSGNTIETEMRINSNIIKTYCPNYTYSMMYQHEAEVGYSVELVSKPVFRCSLEYTFNNDGSLTVSLPAGSIVFDETKYTLNSITPLQYFGGLNLNDEGYLFYPDGSGAISEFSDFRSSDINITSHIYGLDYCYSYVTAIEGVSHRAQVTMPVYGAVIESEPTSITKANLDKLGLSVDKVTNGFFAITEEGDSLSSLYASCILPYVGVYSSFNPYPSDTFSLSGTIAAGSKTADQYKLVSEAKYTGNFTTRYVMLTDEYLGSVYYGQDANANDMFYAADYAGMATYYRDYLKDRGVLSAVENLTEDLPLYIEVLGAMDITAKFLSFPVTKSISLTSFEDVATIYTELSQCETYVVTKIAEYKQLAEAEEDEVQKYQYEKQAERYEELKGQIQNIKNINFKLSGYANGGMSATYPVKLKWAKACGGSDGFEELVSAAATASEADGYNFGIYPDFDFVFINRTDTFDGISVRKIAALMVDNRYASKQLYNSVVQFYETIGTLIVSSDAIVESYDKFQEKYESYGNKKISVSTLGSTLNSNFDKDNPLNREESKALVQQTLDNMANRDGYDVMIDTGNVYALEYASHILNAPIESSRLLDSSYSVPFVGLVLHSYVNYTGTPINYSGSPRYDLLRAIESGASIYYILCYQNTSYMKDDSDLSKYYGVDYINWFDEIVESYDEINKMIGDLQDYEIVDHETIIVEREIDDDEAIANRYSLQAEILEFLDDQLLKAVDIALGELKASEDRYTKMLNFSVDKEALLASFSDILNLSVEELNTECADFIASFNELCAKYESYYDGAEDEANNYDVTFDTFVYGSGKYVTKYTYITDSFAKDENYVKTDYTIDDGNVTIVTYKKGNDVVRFVINFNSFDVTVKLEGVAAHGLNEGCTLKAYSCIRIDEGGNA